MKIARMPVRQYRIPKELCHREGVTYHAHIWWPQIESIFCGETKVTLHLLWTNASYFGPAAFYILPYFRKWGGHSEDT